MNPTDATRLMVDAIRIDGGTQPRVEISEKDVSEYAEAMRDGAEFPPVVTFFDGVDYWLADGFHRWHAARRAGLTGIAATVQQGTKRDAVLYSVGVNGAHGIKRTNADKRKAVMTLLNDTEWREWADWEIARRCAVSNHMVASLRPPRDVTGSSPSEPSEPRTYVTKHGTEATMNTANIGTRVPAEKVARIEEMLRAGAGTDVISAEVKTSNHTIARVRDAMGLATGIDNSRDGVSARRERMREMAAEGNRSDQIADAVGISAQACRAIMRREGIDVPADRVTGRMRLIDSNRVLQAMVDTADGLTADVGLITFSELDTERLDDWLQSLVRSRRALSAFITRLSKEVGSDVEAA